MQIESEGIDKDIPYKSNKKKNHVFQSAAKQTLKTVIIDKERHITIKGSTKQGDKTFVNICICTHQRNTKIYKTNTNGHKREKK